MVGFISPASNASVITVSFLSVCNSEVVNSCVASFDAACEDASSSVEGTQVLCCP